MESVRKAAEMVIEEVWSEIRFLNTRIVSVCAREPLDLTVMHVIVKLSVSTSSGIAAGTVQPHHVGSMSLAEL